MSSFWSVFQCFYLLSLFSVLLTVPTLFGVILPFLKLLCVVMCACLHCDFLNMGILENETEASCNLNFHVFYQKFQFNMNLGNFNSLQPTDNY